MHIGKNLIILRHTRRLTQQEIARRAGMSQANYSKIESDLQRVSPRQIAAFADIFGVGPEALCRSLTGDPGSPATEAVEMLIASQHATIEALQKQIEAERRNWQGLSTPPLSEH